MDDKISIRIGSGGKIHPAFAEKTVINAGKPWAKTSYRYIRLACSCPASQNGHATQRMSILGDGWDYCNCGNH